jgi:hypothetical protein
MRIPWRTLAVQRGLRARSTWRDVHGPEQLAALYLWHRDGRLPPLGAFEILILDPESGTAVDSPLLVDWGDFPWADAIQAVLALQEKR